jgi:hypothetical protein
MNGFFQNAYITRDLEKSMATFKEHHGIDEFIVLSISPEVQSKWGNGPLYAKVALGWIDNLQIELIEPGGGLVNHYTEDLPDDDLPHFHHICMRVPDWDAFKAEAAREGWPIVSEGGVPGCMFAYIDARDKLGHYVEYMWMTDEMWAATGGK